MAENFTVGIYKYTTIPNSFTAKIGNAIHQNSYNSGITYANYDLPVEIPSFVYNKNIKYEIIEIGLSAFRNCQKIPKVIIPPTIITINTWAFDWLVSCTEFIFLPGSKLKTIAVAAFCRCYSIQMLVIPNSVHTISNSSFSFMKSLKYLYICGNPSIGSDILSDRAKGSDIVAPDDLQIFVPFEFTGTSQKRTFIKSYFNKICDFNTKCNSCLYSSFNFHIPFASMAVFITV